ncbi:hypothetical protein WJX73_006523 [Symbiochloris irregularis]|uniref:Uncharacterized protein n=1 Tax=Symbiochloris irregularis TaxID=706552 RepID=A0AAW1PV98_9CHLO
MWRQVLGEAEHVDQLFLLPRPAAVATLSSSQGYLRVWNAADVVLGTGGSTATVASSSSVECTSVDASVLGTASSAKLVQLEGSDAVAVIGSGGAALYSAAKAPKLIASLPGALAVSQPTQAESEELRITGCWWEGQRARWPF